MPKIGLKILNIIVFIVLCTLGVLFLLASPVDPVRMQSRIIVGSILIVLSLVSLITISLLISRNEYGNVRYVKKSDKIQEEVFYSKEVVCPECGEKNHLEMMDRGECIHCGYKAVESDIVHEVISDAFIDNLNKDKLHIRSQLYKTL